MAAKLLHPNLVGAYVYALMIDGVVRYIGKGRRYRMIEHVRLAREVNRRRAAGEKVKTWRLYNKLAKALRCGSKIEHHVIAWDLSDADAFDRERVEIESFPINQLWNLKQGGASGDPAYMRFLWADPEMRRKFSSAIRRGKRKPEFRESARQTAQAHWDDPEFKLRQINRERALWADPEYRAKRIEILRTVWADPERSARKSELVRSQWTPERRAKQREWLAKKFSDPEVVARSVAKAKATRAAKKKERASYNDRSQGCLHFCPE